MGRATCKKVLVAVRRHPSGAPLGSEDMPSQAKRPEFQQSEFKMTHYVLTVSCKSARGIVAAIATFLAGQGCNIVDSSQFDDLDTGKFFMRVSFI
ncbi:MAG: hypothetical protein E5X44_16735, partial [Mesorhizobium sp.]